MRNLGNRFTPSPPVMRSAPPTAPAPPVAGDPVTGAHVSPVPTLSRVVDPTAPVRAAQMPAMSAQTPILQRLAIQPPVRRVAERLGGTSVQADPPAHPLGTQAVVRHLDPSPPTAVQRSPMPMVAPIEETVPGGRNTRTTTSATSAAVPEPASTGRLVILPAIQRSAGGASDRNRSTTATSDVADGIGRDDELTSRPARAAARS